MTRLFPLCWTDKNANFTAAEVGKTSWYSLSTSVALISMKIFNIDDDASIVLCTSLLPTDDACANNARKRIETNWQVFMITVQVFQ